MFDKIDDIHTNVLALEDIEATKDNREEEPTTFPVFMTDSGIDVELEKIAAGPSAQIYNAKMKLEFWLLADYGMTRADFKTLYEDVIKAVAATSGFSDVRFSNVVGTKWEVNGRECRCFQGVIELLTRENWV